MRFHDLRIAIRHLLKSPGFTATYVRDARTRNWRHKSAVFSVVESVLLSRPLPFPASRLDWSRWATFCRVPMWEATARPGVTAPDIQNYTRETHSFESLGAYKNANYELSGEGEPSTNQCVSPLGRTAAHTGESRLLMGRFFTQQEDDPSKRP